MLMPYGQKKKLNLNSFLIISSIRDFLKIHFCYNHFIPSGLEKKMLWDEVIVDDSISKSGYYFAKSCCYFVKSGCYFAKRTEANLALVYSSRLCEVTARPTINSSGSFNV